MRWYLHKAYTLGHLNTSAQVQVIVTFSLSSTSSSNILVFSSIHLKLINHNISTRNDTRVIIDCLRTQCQWQLWLSGKDDKGNTWQVPKWTLNHYLTTASLMISPAVECSFNDAAGISIATFLHDGEIVRVLKGDLVFTTLSLVEGFHKLLGHTSWNINETRQCTDVEVILIHAILSLLVVIQDCGLKSFSKSKTTIPAGVWFSSTQKTTWLTPTCSTVIEEILLPWPLSESFMI